MAKVKKVKAEGKSEVTKPKLEYHLEITTGDTVFKGEAVSLEQALTDFVNSPSFPFGAKGKTIVKFGNSKSERLQVWQPVKARRLFNQISLKPTSLEFLASQLKDQLI